MESPQSVSWPVPVRLCRGGYGACVGFTWAHALSSLGTTVDDKFAIESIYWEAQRIDSYPGGSYPGAHPISAGTSVRAGAQVVQGLGLIRDCLWLQTIDEVLAAVTSIGPVVFGCEWHREMSKPDHYGFVLPAGGKRGRHCILLNEIHTKQATETTIDPAESWLGFINSFGPEWGLNGGARIRIINMYDLMSSMEACVPL